jgi:hypothetical protein
MYQNLLPLSFNVTTKHVSSATKGILDIALTCTGNMYYSYNGQWHCRNSHEPKQNLWRRQDVYSIFRGKLLSQDLRYRAFDVADKLFSAKN